MAACSKSQAKLIDQFSQLEALLLSCPIIYAWPFPAVPAGDRQLLILADTGIFPNNTTLCLMQGILASAQRKSKEVSERVAYASSEGTKLDSRLTHAIDQWQSGLSKTQAASRQLASLASSVQSPIHQPRCISTRLDPFAYLQGIPAA